MDMLEYAGIPVTALIIGISEVLKRLGFNVKYIPLVNLLMGVAAGICLNPGNRVKGLITGMAAGLSACGLYSGVKNVREGLRNRA